jgi:hypothetical protein
MKINFLRSAYNEILKTIGSKKSETGGILLGNREDFVVQKFVFDPYGSTSSCGYDPDVNYINKVIKEEWENNQLALLGFIHSHPRGYDRLSGDYGNNTGDLGYLRAIFKAIPALDKFLVPIVFSKYDGKDFKLIPYVTWADNINGYKALGYDIIPDNEYNISITNKNVGSESGKKGLKNTSRLIGSIDIELMKQTHIVGVGCGGACGIYENFVRSGLEKLTVIDYDFVDDSNITTQGYNLSEIGMPKVDALKRRLQLINPNVEIQAIKGDFLKFNDEEIERICAKSNILLMMTDNFYAQARGNLVSLKYHIPAIFAIMYEKARASEIVFTIPNVTPACFRCAVSSRYKAYFEGGYENTVKSVGSTIFHTYYLNSVIGLVALAILHNKTDGFEFSNWFGDYWDRNLIQIRHHPEYSSHGIFSHTFKNIPRVFNFDAIWQKIEPEVTPKYEICPDCYGKLLMNNEF